MWMQWDPYPTAEDESEVGGGFVAGGRGDSQDREPKIFHQKFIPQKFILQEPATKFIAPQRHAYNPRMEKDPAPIAKRPRNDKASRGAAARVHTSTTTMAGAASVSPDKPLTNQQRLFAKYWAEGESVQTAMARAGYSVTQYSYGYRMQKMPNVRALYMSEKALYEEASQMSRKKVMDMLLEAYDVAKTVSEPSSMVGAAREIGRMCGYYEPTKATLEISVNGSISIDRMNRLSDEELLKIIEQGASNALLPQLPPPEDE